MTDLFDFDAKSNRFAVMGNPVAHSQSPRIHRLFARQFDIALEYDRIQVDAGGFAQAVSHFAAHGGAGLNVTVPFKVEAWQLCTRAGHRTSARARRAEAVNTMRFARDRSDAAFGDNTDGVGLIRDLEGNLGRAIAGARVLILGAGGAVRGVLGPLAQCRPARLLIANRTAHKARELAAHYADELGARIGGCGYEQLDERLGGERLGDDEPPFDLIINGSAASIAGEVPPLDARCLGAGSLAYDMMYAPAPTAFMRWAQANGGAVCDGLGMLVEQAAESFYLWHDQRPDTAAVIAALRDSRDDEQ
ncbi:MAG: shikimate dehydrogenase [bacterium]